MSGYCRTSGREPVVVAPSMPGATVVASYLPGGSFEGIRHGRYSEKTEDLERRPHRGRGRVQESHGESSGAAAEEARDARCARAGDLADRSGRAGAFSG